MNFRRKAPEDPELNLIPMIDVLIILLIFLLLTSSFDARLRLGIQLPKASGSEKSAHETSIRVAISAEGYYDLQGARIPGDSTGSLVDALRKAADGNGDPLILIDADEKSTHQALVALLDALHLLNFRRIGFSTRKDYKSTAPFTLPQRP